MAVEKNTENQSVAKENSKKKAVWLSLLWANVSMLVVVLATVLFMYFDYKHRVKYSTSFSFEISFTPFIVAYIIGMLILWGIIYKYESKDIVKDSQTNQDHNIYY